MSLTPDRPLSIASQTELVHGFTLADVQRAARKAAGRTNHYPAHVEEREAAAWHAIVVHLYECGCGWDHLMCNRPAGLTFQELMIAGMRGISAEDTRHKQTHGLSRKYPGERSPRFNTYWGMPPKVKDEEGIIRPAKYHRDLSDGFSENLCERLALREVLAALTDLEYQTLATLAAHDNSGTEAAEAVGLDYRLFMTRVARMRQRAKGVWFEPDELPREKKVTGDACLSGHSRAEHGHRDSKGRWVCRPCKAAAQRRRRHSDIDASREQSREAMRRRRASQAEAEALPEADRDPAA